MVPPPQQHPAGGSWQRPAASGAAGGPVDHPSTTTWTVAELAVHLSRLVVAAHPDDLWVQGQIRNLKRAASGHVYFTLAEPTAAGDAPMAAVAVVLLSAEKRMVNDLLRRAGGAVRMEDGIEVRIEGRLRWWAPSGQLQLRMSSIDPAWTLGRLAEDRERVLSGLAAEGLLDRNRDRPMALVPLRIGLVTSVGSAAHADFLAELEASSYGFDVVVADARTQGLDCERSVVSALRALATAAPPVDVVALVRGGGSRTDLAAFDAAGIARAIADMPVPVMTGIGHEIDASIADVLAWQSFKTPTAVAADLVDRVAGFLRRSDDAWAAAAGRTARALLLADERLRRQARRVAQASRAGLSGQERSCVDASRRLRRGALRKLDHADRLLGGLDAHVRAHDPVRVLARGWSITRDVSGAVVVDPATLAPGDELETTLATGRVRSRVSEVPQP